jgi:predicted metalloprotease with PDZ domain
LNNMKQNYNPFFIFETKINNMFKTFLLIIPLFLAFSLNAQSVHYDLRMSKPQNHYFEVEMTIENHPAESFEVKMPVWAPGSYLVREFSRNVNLVLAKNEKGESLQVEKKSKNTWEIRKGNAKKVSISYEVYAFELSVRTSFLDLTHGFVSGSGVFMYVADWKEKQGTLTVHPYKDFKKVTTSLKRKTEGISGDGQHHFTFTNYDELADCPIEIGNHELFDFTASGVKHTVAMYGPGNYDIPSLKRDMAKIITAATDVFGENPNENYVFIIHNVVNGQGGLEHSNSTTLSVNRWTYEGSSYLDFLSLVAHEYFHLWNVKRIRPLELGPFNYDEENYTTLLWVMEGFTSYYDELLLRRAGFYTKERMVQKLSSSLNYVEGSVGTRVQPVAHASFDAWIKAYRPNENSANTTMTYYSRGAVLAAVMDAQIITKFKGKKSLDDFLQKLYVDFYKKLNRGFSEKEFEKAYSDFMGENMDDFFKNYVYDTKVPDYKSIFEKVGLQVTYTGSKSPSFGASFSQSGGKTIVKAIRAESSAELCRLECE